eukprot:TRINITY_DN40412_c0_g1_i1.p1 TRINITY_DN40412_c0_g1~~TRINITY_DN40412_c0_g1_i1.p1  ORF type:complete len:348 (+),score=35.86 TRINITY_DN40412_c0_g1_i1:86-1129(+)
MDAPDGIPLLPSFLQDDSWHAGLDDRWFNFRNEAEPVEDNNIIHYVSDTSQHSTSAHVEYFPTRSHIAAGSAGNSFDFHRLEPLPSTVQGLRSPSDAEEDAIGGVARRPTVIAPRNNSYRIDDRDSVGISPSFVGTSSRSLELASHIGDALPDDANNRSLSGASFSIWSQDPLLTVQGGGWPPPNLMPHSDRASGSSFAPPGFDLADYRLDDDPIGAVAQQSRPSVSLRSDGVTTLMVRNIPVPLMPADVMREIDDSGFADKYDIFYMPFSVAENVSKGYAFINFETVEDAAMFSSSWHGSHRFGDHTKHAINVSVASVQGREANLEKFRKNKVYRIRNSQFRPFVR